MTFTSFKDRLAAGEMLRVFCVGRIIHPVVFDLHGMVGGFHGIWIDQEHCGTTYEQIALASACCRANGFDSIVRMPLSNYAQATANLEAGAGGLMAARVETVAEAENFVRWTKFAPRGRRGLNTSGYDSAYGGKSAKQFTADANRDSFVAIQIETLPALAVCNAIAEINGVDMLFVGPADLSQEMEALGEWDNPQLWSAFEKVAAACKRHKKHWGTIAVNPEFAQRATYLGCKLLSFGMDAIMLRRGIEATKKQFGEFFA
jgi:2-dehydro-3-deoxyglucarate aldolase/4-hydroxy-2-oxoheptanedioate aldolase